MSLADAFAQMQAAAEPAKPKPSRAQAPKLPRAEAPKRSGTVPNLQPFAKSAHPDYAPVKIYVRKQTRKQAERKWEDQTEGDFSDLVEHLLQQYLST